MPTRERGFAYCINDSRPYRAMLDLSVRSLKRFHSDMPVEVVKLRSGSDFFDSLRWHLGSTVERLVRGVTVGNEYAKKARHKAMAEKIKLFSDPPFRHTVYLDCDTLVLRPMTTVFDRLADGADVVLQQSIDGDEYGPRPPFTEAPFRRYNSGVVGLSPAFARDFAALVATCTLDIAGLQDQDQYVFSRLLDLMDRSRVAELKDLQITNDPAGCKLVGAGSSTELAGRMARDPSPPYMVLHYLMKKKPALRSVRKRV